jgi:hypothetical protein
MQRINYEQISIFNNRCSHFAEMEPSVNNLSRLDWNINYSPIQQQKNIQSKIISNILTIISAMFVDFHIFKLSPPYDRFVR